METGDFPPGVQLHEVPLAARFGVSRAILREAMSRLVAEGMLLHIPNRGVYMPSLTPERVEELYTARFALELAAISIGQGAGTIDTDQLRAICERMRRAVEKPHQLDIDRRELTDADLAFHAELLHGVGNRWMDAWSQTLRTETVLCLNALGPIYIDPEVTVANHFEIVEAIETGDTARVEEALSRHNSRGLRIFTSTNTPLTTPPIM
jgi:DNA-binding GntR family transcriptional regulator